MSEINYLSVLLATISGFAVSGVWYSAFGQAMAKLQGKKSSESERMPAWIIVAELARSAVVTAALAYLLNQLGVSAWPEAALYGVLLWLAFPVVLLAGSVIHENVPVKLAAIHAGDWLLKLAIIATIVAL